MAWALVNQIGDPMQLRITLEGASGAQIRSIAADVQTWRPSLLSVTQLDSVYQIRSELYRVAATAQEHKPATNLDPLTADELELSLPSKKTATRGVVNRRHDIDQ
jgi:hypothetical protein